jgi:DNA-binding NarL/FixJ family response regulator
LYTSLGRGIRASLGPEARPVPPETPTPAKSALRRAAKASKKRASRSAAAEKPRLKTRIAELAAQGLSPAEIASQLDLSHSEVDLALSLLGRGTG